MKRDNFKKYIFNKYFLFSLVFTAINGFLILFFFTERYNNTDSNLYVSTINFLSNGSGTPNLGIILKPFPLLIGVFLSPIFSPTSSILIQNTIFYFLCSIFIFLIADKIYKDKKQAFFSVCLLSSAYPVEAYGLAVLIDIGGWFFYLLSAFLALNFIDKPGIRRACLVGLSVGMGMLFKELPIAGLILFASLVFIATNLSIRDKIKYCFICGLSFLLPFFIKEIIVYNIFSFNSLDWYFSNWDRVGVVKNTLYYYSPLRILIEIFRVFIFGWILFFVGLRKEFLYNDKNRQKILIAFLIPSFSFLLWSWPHNRIMFALLTFLVLLGSYGILGRFKSEKKNLIQELSLLVLYVITNYFFLDFLLKYGDNFKNLF